uniref:Uncharacterized protein n=1 Tax=Romanomermis culicivorax TaxID=13658 RepID=A0A915J3Q4_ROMCU
MNRKSGAARYLAKTTDGNLQPNRTERKFLFRSVTLCRSYSVPSEKAKPELSLPSASFSKNCKKINSHRFHKTTEITIRDDNRINLFVRNVNEELTRCDFGVVVSENILVAGDSLLSKITNKGNFVDDVFDENVFFVAFDSGVDIDDKDAKFFVVNFESTDAKFVSRGEKIGLCEVVTTNIVSVDRRLGVRSSGGVLMGGA